MKKENINPRELTMETLIETTTIAYFSDAIRRDGEPSKLEELKLNDHVIDYTNTKK